LQNKSCSGCKAKFYDAEKSSTAARPSKKQESMADTDFGNLNVEMYVDKVCVANKSNCASNFAFYTAVKDDLSLIGSGGVIGFSP